MAVENAQGTANIKLRVKADFKNQGTHEQYMKAVTVVIEMPNRRRFDLYQIEGKIQRDLRYGPNETRTDDIMGFQTDPQSRLAFDGFRTLYNQRSKWRCYLEVAAAEGRKQKLPLALTDVFPSPSELGN